jgi:hypothetical protein
VPVATSDWSGARSATNSNMITVSVNDAWQNLSISWVITDNLDGTLNYEYTISGLNKELSNFILEVSPLDGDNPFGFNNILNSNFKPSEINTFSQSGFIPFPGGVSIDGIKFEFNDDGTPLTVSFDSDRIPVWGDFFMKDGFSREGPVYAYNTQFGVDPATDATMLYTGWIPRPDTQTVLMIPEPITYALLGSLLGTAVLAARLRKAVT